MRRIGIATLLLAFVLILVPPAPAQQPQPAPEDETPSLSTDDVRPSTATSTAPLGPVASVDDLFERAYAELERAGASHADVAELRARLDRGEEIRFAVRFDIGPTGSVTNFANETGTGLASIDRLVTKDAPSMMIGRDAANFRNVHVEFGVTKTVVRINASATAPTVEKATEIEQFVGSMQSSAAGSRGRTPFDGLSVTRQGADLSASLTIATAELAGAR